MSRDILKAVTEGRELIHKRPAMGLSAQEYKTILFTGGQDAPEPAEDEKCYMISPAQLDAITDYFFYAGVAIGYRIRKTEGK